MGILVVECLLKRSIKKHGIENHSREIINYCSSQDELKKPEKDIVNESLIDDPFSLNLKTGGEGGSNKNSLSKESRKLISIGNTGNGHKVWSSYSRQKLAKLRNGRKHSQELKDKVSADNKGKKRTEENKKCVSETLKKKAREIGERQRLAITGRHFYNDGAKVILVFDTDPILSDSKWKLGKNI